MSCNLVGHTSERRGCAKINLKNPIYGKDPTMIAAQTCVCVCAFIFCQTFWGLDKPNLSRFKPTSSRLAA